MVWAIGDIHGRIDLLNPLLDHILEDAHAAPRLRTIVIGLGDYVDRGARSREVIDRLIELQAQAVGTRFLMGNHEKMMLDFLADADVGPVWADFGGRETLCSYGIPPPRGMGWRQTSARLNTVLPPAHRRFLGSLLTHCRIGDYFFAHAGVRPGIPLDGQSRRDLLWIRDAFLNHEAGWPKVIVHGHTPSERIVCTPARIGVDTGAHATGVLSAVRLKGVTRAGVRTRITPDGVRVCRSPL